MTTNVPALADKLLASLGIAAVGVSYDEDAPVMETVTEEITDVDKNGLVFTLTDEKGNPLLRKVTRPVKDEKGEHVKEERFEISFAEDVTDEQKAQAYEALAAMDKNPPPPVFKTIKDAAASADDATFLKALRAEYLK